MQLAIYTFVTNWDEYNKMRASFEAAGFTHGSVHFFPLDNSSGNNFDPFREIEIRCSRSSHDYVVFCHQDIRIEEELTYAVLASWIEILNQTSSKWAVAGNAGLSFNLKPLWNLKGPTGDYQTVDKPVRVLSLDENFLLFNSKNFSGTTTELSGFHFYGSDVCLGALISGRPCFVIPYSVRHLSAGNAKSDAFRQAAREFQTAWSAHFVYGRYWSTCIEFVLGTPGPVFGFLDQHWVRDVMRSARIPLIRSGWGCLFDFGILLLRAVISPRTYRILASKSFRRRELV